jgi:hypothetical protein
VKRRLPGPKRLSYNLRMRALASSLVLLGGVLAMALGCGQSDGGSGSPAAAGVSTAGSNGAGTAAGGSPIAGSASGGSSSAGGSQGGNPTGGSSGGVSATGGQSEAQAGDGNVAGGAGGLVDCDPKNILCKRLAPTCDAGQVPSVSGSCYGDCVKIERCACDAAEQCPEPNEYTCWSKQHCGPFVE